MIIVEVVMIIIVTNLMFLATLTVIIIFVTRFKYYCNICNQWKMLCICIRDIDFISNRRHGLEESVLQERLEERTLRSTKLARE